MSKINFFSSWPTLNSNTWSGTPYGIYKSLESKAEVDLYNVGLKQDSFSPIKNILNFISFGMFSVKIGEKEIKKEKISPKTPSIVFSEYRTKHLSNTYCYQDLSVDYLVRAIEKDSGIKKYSRSWDLVPLFVMKHKNRYAKKFYNSCAGIFTMSEWLKKDLIENTGIDSKKVHCVGGGCNIDISKIDYSLKNGNRFLFVGKDWDKKNGEIVVKAFEKTAKQFPEADLELYVAGPTECPECVRDKKNIHFLGLMASEELYKYYNLCDYFVMPSKFDAYGLVFGEALCFGLPCIGKNCYAMPEFIKDGENGYLIQDSDENELAEVMQKMVINGKDMAKTVQNNKEFYTKLYSWDNVTDKILQVLKNDGYEL